MRNKNSKKVSIVITIVASLLVFLELSITKFLKLSRTPNYKIFHGFALFFFLIIFVASIVSVYWSQRNAEKFKLYSAFIMLAIGIIGIIYSFINLKFYIGNQYFNYSKLNTAIKFEAVNNLLMVVGVACSSVSLFIKK